MNPQLIISNITGVTLPYNIYGCDYYGNNCILLATITTSTTPITIELPSMFITYPALTVKLGNCINCDYSEFITASCFVPQSKNFQTGEIFFFMDGTEYTFQT